MVDDAQARKQLVAGVFSRAAATYDQRGPQFFTHFGRRLVELAGIRSDAAVLDVATGRGAVLFPAAERAGPSGRVVGIDLAEAMVQETAAELGRRGLRNAAVRLMDAEHLEFAGASFDHVLCGFALFFFPHLDATLVEFRRVLRPGGVIAVSTWGASGTRWPWYQELLKKYVTPVQLSCHELDTPERLDTLLGQAGFADVRVLEEDTDFTYADEREWWNTLWSHGSRASLERLAADDLEKLRTEVFERMQAERSPDGFRATLHVLYGLGVKPA